MNNALDFSGPGVSAPELGHFRKTRALTFGADAVDPERVVYMHARLREGRTVPPRLAKLAMSRQTSERFAARSKDLGFAPVMPFRNRAEREHEDLLDRAESNLRFATIGDLATPNRTGLPMGVAFDQPGMVGDEALPVYVAGADFRGYYPILGQEAFQIAKLVSSMTGKANRSDVKIKYIPVTTQEYFHEAVVTETERQAGAFLPTGIDTIKTNVLRNQVDLVKENDQATLVMTAANYASGFSVDCSASTNLHRFTNTSADPLTDIDTWIEKVRTGCRQVPDSVFTTPGAAKALRRHPVVRDAVKYTGTLASPAAFVPYTALAELLGLRIVIAGAGVASTLGSAVSDVWGSITASGDVFAILCTGGGRLMAQRFGITVSAPGFPSFLPYVDNSVGSRTATVYKYSNAWNTHLVQNTNTASVSNAGFLAYKAI